MERAFRRWCRSASVKDEGEVGRVSNSAHSKNTSGRPIECPQAQAAYWRHKIRPPRSAIGQRIWRSSSQDCQWATLPAVRDARGALSWPLYMVSERPACGCTGLCDHTCTFSLHYPLHEVKDCVCFAWYPQGLASVWHILETKATSTLLKINLKFF